MDRTNHTARVCDLDEQFVALRGEEIIVVMNEAAGEMIENQSLSFLQALETAMAAFHAGKVAEKSRFALQNNPPECAYCHMLIHGVPTLISPPPAPGKPSQLLFHAQCYHEAGSSAIRRGHDLEGCEL